MKGSKRGAESGMQDAWRRQTDVKFSCLVRVLSLPCVLSALLTLNATAIAAPDTGDLEGRPIQTIEVVFEGSPPSLRANEQVRRDWLEV